MSPGVRFKGLKSEKPLGRGCGQEGVTQGGTLPGTCTAPSEAPNSAPHPPPQAASSSGQLCTDRSVKLKSASFVSPPTGPVPLH